ncbi:UDP-N-acetylglucosamine 1-carboxyvinyltransferase [Christiangramia gaetbulicola]|uniref:UDP-N-acetylglucosamine 1-carboxyvinyltransferase n=1 Tax=Christiangramia gaetbulicola TaxID=703340 RepID=A0A2T6AL18_9FLAO|nr:UDP-N-acetylglucosamine 1-carboxyvinyltransferase [Christiangramia gaetbulicola]PTX44487.1 UDP-N-acetylglucosamine 1-carboxyvinyltransferase [Christiangramia gaetbulicola]
MMDKKEFKISKSVLKGKVKVSGAKNSALKLIAASLLTREPIHLYGFPSGLLDVKIHLEMIKKLGKEYRIHNDQVSIIENTDSPITQLKWEDRSIRNTLLILGTLVTRFGKGSVPMPGGCKLGDRKFDLHVMVLESMGAKVWEENECLCASVEGNLKGADIQLPIRSTGATENALLCGTLAEGRTTIWNPHIRPEVLDLIEMLNKMGASIEVQGQKCIVVNGVNELSGTQHTVIPDNMEAITWAIAATITRGDVEIENFPFEHLEVPMVFLRESGMKYYRNGSSMIVRGGIPYPVEISTGPYPGINSDMQPLFALYGANSKGNSKIVDLRFPGRYGYAEEFAKMGLNYSVEGDLLVIEGGKKLYGTEVIAVDLRAGISLLLAGLISEGTTTIKNAWMIERGYENLENKLKNLGVSNFKILKGEVVQEL